MTPDKMKRIRIIDSHTGGEPTRIVVSGGPDLGGGTVAEQLEIFRDQHDRFRCAVVNEPRGSDVIVGALLVEPADKTCVVGVIFFNNVGVLQMCGHGTIGLVVTLAHLGRIQPGAHRIETCVGVVTATLHADGSVSVENVPSYRKAKGVKVNVPGVGEIAGDLAWGGNWFFLVEQHGQPVAFNNIEKLTELSWAIRQAVNTQGYPEVDHVELFGPPQLPGGHSRNFVLCPGKAYDRSPCGTGTSAKLACLAADGKLAEGATWVQESVIGSAFTGRFTRAGDQIIPTITGTAFVNAEVTLLLNESDPFCWGITAEGSGTAGGSGTAASIAALDLGTPRRSVVAPLDRSLMEPVETGAAPTGFDPSGSRAAVPAAVPEPAAPWPHAPPHWVFAPGSYFVTASTFHRERILDTPAKLDAVTQRLLETAFEFGWTLRAWAVLSNHYHFVAQSPAASAESLRDWLKEFHRTAAMRVNELSAMRGRRVWMNFRETRLTHQTSYLARLRYVNENPVHHQLVARAMEYRWCSAAWFEANAPKSFVASVARFKIDKLKIWDDFD